MAMQTGMGLSKILILAGAGYTGSIVLRGGRLSDILSELQSLVKGLESGDPNSEPSDAIAAQVRRLAMEVRQIASSRQITVLNGSSGQIGVTSLAVPAAVVGAVGYGYMWWKGLSLSDLMYVTKSNMANAVSSMTKHLEHVSSVLAATKKHLTQRIQNLDVKLDDQKEMSKLIKDEVTVVRDHVSQIGFDLDSIRGLVSGLDGRICSLEDKQDIANAGVWYLCNVVGGKDPKMAEYLKAVPKPRKPHSFLTFADRPNLMGLKQITDTIANSRNNGIMPTDVDNSGPRNLSRTSSVKYTLDSVEEM